MGDREPVVLRVRARDTSVAPGRIASDLDGRYWAELRVAQAYITRPRLDSQGKPLDPTTARRDAYEDLLWASINTKEYRYNH